MVKQSDAWYDERIKELEESKMISITTKKKFKRRGTLVASHSLNSGALGFTNQLTISNIKRASLPNAQLKSPMINKSGSKLGSVANSGTTIHDFKRSLTLHDSKRSHQESKKSK